MNHVQELMRDHHYKIPDDTDLVLPPILYTNNATLSASTTTYTTDGELPPTGNYSLGGIALIGTAISFSGTTAWITFDSAAWPASTFSNVRGALIYDHSQSDAAIAVLDFGSDKSTSNTTFIVQMPIAGASSALIRIA